ncbi:MAG: hypothetical protein ACRD0P_20345 [Stackebrandtia sp.]
MTEEPPPSDTEPETADPKRVKRRSFYAQLIGGTIAVVVFAVVLTLVGFDESDSERKPSHDETTNEGPYRVSDSGRLCSDFDWSVVDEAFEYDDDGWRDELAGDGDHYPHDDGAGNFACQVNLPVKNATAKPWLRASWLIEPTPERSRENFRKDVKDLEDSDENHKPLGIENPPQCQESIAQVVSVKTGDEPVTSKMASVDCLDGNLEVHVSLAEFDVDDGSGSRDAADTVEDILLPLVGEVFAALSKQD